jgi:putative glutamine amidotransferase
MDLRPEIGLNLDFETKTRPFSYLRPTYYDAVWRAGGRPVLLAPIADEEFIDAMLARVDALVLTGGDDLDPGVYGCEKHDKCNLMHPRRQEFDLLLARRALARGLPILGICAGLQTLNVVLGGDLIQDIPSLVPGALCHHSHDADAPAEHEVRVTPGSMLAEWLGTERLFANSCHHQSIGRPGAGLAVSALAPDGVIEAVELGDGAARGRGPVVAVQWHPERIFERPPHGRLFAAFVDVARARRGGR